LRNGSFIPDWTAWPYERRHRRVSVATSEGTRLIGPKDPLLALWVSQRELLEQNAAQQQKLLSEFQTALGKSQTAWSEQAKALAQQSLNAGLQAAQNSTALLLEEAARMNGAAVRKAFEEGITRMEVAIAASRRIATWSLVAAAVALAASICTILAHVLH
jgi:Transcriptional activator TraM